MMSKERLFVSSPPIFNIERLEEANERSDKWLAEKSASGNSSLSVACRLGLYNLLSSGSIDSDSLEAFFKRFGILTQKEALFADKNNPFPPIGVEVEVPRKVMKPENLPAYADFFDKIGMPRNKVNKHLDDLTYLSFSFWEFSPHPSYYAGTQSSIISELIKGRFIPSLLDSQNPEDIRRYLDDKLVSLHVNLEINRQDSTDPEEVFNYEIFSEMFALALTSPERLEFRRSKEHFQIKNNAQERLKTRHF